MKRNLIVLASVFCLATAAYAEEKIEDCTFWKSKLIMSKSSGAVGHVITGKLSDTKQCQYDVRFYLGGQLVLVKAMRDYELMWAPPATDKTKPVVQKAPEDYFGGLEFGGK